MGALNRMGKGPVDRRESRGVMYAMVALLAPHALIGGGASLCVIEYAFGV